MIRTRFAPSPTGVLHIGSVRTALFCWLYARHSNGQFILRIEDTDKERSTQDNVDAILDSLDWLGLNADEDPVFQSDRFDRYHEIANQWLESGKAYRCYCTKEELDAIRNSQKQKGEKMRYNGHCRELSHEHSDKGYVLRFKNPKTGSVVVNDEVKGRVEFKNEELDDLIIVRSDGSPTYNFTVVVDDADMKISHVIRGDDHLNNTPRQINMFDALGVAVPSFSHIPMTLGEDGSKLSKRHGAMDIREYREQGYIPEALLNFMVRLGWSHGDKEEFSISEMIALFDVKDINQSASTFSPDKLIWLNQQHMMKAPIDSLEPLLEYQMERLGINSDHGPSINKVIKVYRERAETFEEMAKSCRYCFEDFDEIDEKAAKKHLRPIVLEPLQEICDRFDVLTEWSLDEIDACIQKTVSKFDINMGKLGQPLRVAVTGGSSSPSIGLTVELIGRDRVLERLQKAIEVVKKRSDSN